MTSEEPEPDFSDAAAEDLDGLAHLARVEAGMGEIFEDDAARRRTFVRILPWVALPLLAPPTLDIWQSGGDRAWAALLHVTTAGVFVVTALLSLLASGRWVVAMLARLDLLALLGLLLAVFVFLREGFSMLWVGVLPPLAVFVLGLREGLGWCAAILLVWAIVLERPDLLGAYSGEAAWPSRDEAFDFAVAFVVLSFLAAGYEYLRHRAQARMDQQSDALLQTSRLESIGRLTSGVAHDFNNLLMVIIGNLDLLAMEAERAGLSVRGLEQARSASSRAAELTGKLLSFARRQPLRPETVDLGDLLGELESLFTSSLGETVTVATGVADAPLACRADRNQLENALLNLAMNARDAMPDGGELTIVAQRYQRAGKEDDDLAPGDYVRISVTDTGPGIPPDVRERVFEPFFTIKELGAGTGLGLSMVQGFVRQSGGEVRIRDVQPVGAGAPGTTVDLYLPSVDPDRTGEHSITGGSRSSW